MKTSKLFSTDKLTQLLRCLAISFLAITFLSTIPAVAGYDEHPDKSKSEDIGDPIDSRTQSYYFKVPMFNLGGIVPVKFGLIYQSVSNFSSHTRFLNNVPEVSRWNRENVYASKWGDGEGELLFDDNESIAGVNWWHNGPNSTYQYGLQEIPGASNWFYMMDPSDQSVYIYQKENKDDDTIQFSRLLYHIDRNGNTVTYTYGSWNDSYPDINITDGFRTIMVTTDGEMLRSVSDGTRIYTIGHDANKYISTIQNPLNQTVTYQYTDNGYSCLTKQTLPEGNTPYTQTYPTSLCKVISQTDAYGNTVNISVVSNPDTEKDQVTETRPDDTKVVYEYSAKGGSPLSIEDASGNKANFSINDKDQTVGISDRMGDSTSTTYHAETGFVSSTTNAEGQTTSYTYTAQNQTFTNPNGGPDFTFTFYNLTRTDYPDGTFETFVYDTKGNMTTHTNRKGEITQYTYNTQGLVLRIINPAGGVTTYTYNLDGTRASSTDTDIGTTTYGYDSFRRLITINAPGAGQTDIVYDLMDRIVSVSDENNHITEYKYDNNGNTIEIKEPSGSITKYTYDLMDRVNSMTDSTDSVTTLEYNYRNQITSIVNNGEKTSFGYNSNSWKTSITRNAKTSSINYDAEGVVSGAISASGNTLQKESNKLGYITALTLPDGQRTDIAYDSMGRISSITDPLSRKTQYSYSNSDELTGVTLEGGVSTSYIYNNLGKLTTINDLNNNNWEFRYSSFGRTTSTSDPLNNKTEYTYNTSGQIESLTYPDADTVNYSYNGTGTLIRTLHSDGTDITFTYDANGNLVSTNNLALTYNSDDEIVSSTYNGHSFDVTYDASGRVATATYAGALSVTYSYNSDNLLSQVKDTLGNQIDYTYDDDGKLTKVSRSNGVNTSFAWNNNSQLSGIVDGDFTALAFSYDDAGQIISIKGVWPLDPSTLLTTSKKSFTVDAASQLSSSGYSYDKRGRATSTPDHSLSWNGAEQLTTLNSVTFEYNGLNEIVSRSEDGVTINYYHNNALKDSPIVAEQEGSSFSRYYIYTPSGELIYSIAPQDSNAVSFYHTDQVGSTLALTDGSGSVTDKYAYSPFGELLKHTGSSTQPYTFVGTKGVRQEGNIYQMRLRYYDATTQKFLSRETMWPRIANPKSLNPYQYALSTPLYNVDTSGLLSTVAGHPTAWGFVSDSSVLGSSNSVSTSSRETNTKAVKKTKKRTETKAKKTKKNLKGIVGGKVAVIVAENVAKKVAKKVAVKALEKVIAKKLTKELGKKVAKTVAKTLAKDAMAATLKAVSPVGTLIGGASAIYTMGTWAVADNAGELMQEELSYQVTELAESTSIGKSIVRGVGGIVSWFMGD